MPASIASTSAAVMNISSHISRTATMFSVCKVRCLDHISITGLAVDFVNLALFCASCNDYVYDAEFEEILVMERSRVASLVNGILLNNIRVDLLKTHQILNHGFRMPNKRNN